MNNLELILRIEGLHKFSKSVVIENAELKHELDLRNKELEYYKKKERKLLNESK